MRQIGQLTSQEHARLFSDYLLVKSIDNQVEHDHEHPGAWVVWIHDEDKIDLALKMLEEFRDNPSDARYSSEAKAASSIRSAKEKEEEAYRQKTKSRRHLFRPLRGYGFGPFTFALIAISVGVFFLSKFANDLENIRSLFISDPGLIGARTFLPEVLHGQIWRLFTPMFIHLSFLHILFNMLWLADLGSMVEGRQSTGYLVVFVLVISACSNVAQYMFGGPLFGGMSGVVYGLLGYVWIRGKFDPGSGLFLQPTTVMLMIAWFFLGLTGMMRMANMAHGAGLVIGMAWGYLAAKRYR